MATKKKELLEQEAPVSETIALEDSPFPPRIRPLLMPPRLTART